MRFITSKDVNMGTLDLRTHFCGIVEVAENSVTLMITPRGALEAESLNLGALGAESLTLVSVPIGQAGEVVENLKKNSMSQKVSNLPRVTSQWPKGITLYPYKPELTPTGKLSKSTPSTYEESFEPLILDIVDCLHVLTKLSGGKLVSGMAVDYRDSGADLYVEVLLDFNDVGGSVNRNTPLGKWLRENRGCVGQRVVALFDPDSTIKELFLVAW